MDYNSKRIGNLTEIQCISSFIELGYNVSIPFGDCEKYDFIADYKGKLLKIQCKTAKSSDNGATFDVNGRTNMKIKGEVKHHLYTKEEIDFFATYFNSKCYLIPVEQMGTSKKLRLVAPQNFQKERVSFAKDYEIERILQEIN